MEHVITVPRVRELHLLKFPCLVVMLCVQLFVMEQLNPDQQEQLKKCSTERLRLKLVQAGEKEDAVSQMDRPKLLEALAQRVLASARDPEEGAAMEATGPQDATELRLREIALEEKKVEAAKETRKMEMELELRKLEIDREVRLLELKTKQETGGDPSNTPPVVQVDSGPSRTWDDSLADRTKRYGETLKHVLPFMPVSYTHLTLPTIYSV